ncbi:hypothetical protein B0J14DRAFT_684383 [Halenospora varia]|nr:hypothetical protein B0J14DRAFT_684383 [Halenospora varia]
MERSLRNTTCSKGHTHPPWNTTGILRVAKCESICGFCQKETKTAANLRKHVAIHIKNERLNLTIAEGSSGRGRLYSYPNVTYTTQAMPGPSSYIPVTNPPNYSDRILSNLYPEANKDLFRTLREHKIHTKTAWTVIPSSEGNRILDLCKSLSVTQSASSPILEGRGGGAGQRIPCYNRETLFDEEWQAHMRDVHGIFLIWPETWMRRIEVLDLEPYGGILGD